MSCDGNRFVCGMKRFDKHKTTERPVLNDLHNNNEKKLQEMIQLRNLQDQGIFQPISVVKPQIPDTSNMHK